MAHLGFKLGSNSNLSLGQTPLSLNFDAQKIWDSNFQVWNQCGSTLSQVYYDYQYCYKSKAEKIKAYVWTWKEINFMTKRDVL